MSLWKVSLSQNSNEIISGFLPWFFCSFLGASWKLFWASCRLPYSWYYLLSPKEAQKASRKPPRSYKKFQGRNPEIISLLFWDKLIFHKDIIKSSDLYVNKTNKRRDCKRRSLDWTIMRNIFLGQVLIVCKLCQDPWWILNALHITARDQFIWLYIVRPTAQSL